MHEHTPARWFLLLLVLSLFMGAVGLWLGNAWVAGLIYVVAIAGLLVMTLPHGQPGPPEQH